MNKLPFLLLILMLVGACKSSTEENNDEPSLFEQGVMEEVDVDKLSAIRKELNDAMPFAPKDLYKKAIALHLQFADQNPKHEFAATALNHGQAYYDQLQDFRSSARIIERILEEYPNFEKRKEITFLLATHYDILRETDKAKAVLENYLKDFKDLTKEEREDAELLIEVLPYTLEERIAMHNN